MHEHDLFLERALLEDARIPDAKLDAARQHARQNQVDLEDALVATSAVTSTELALIKSDICEVPFVDLSDYEICFDNTKIVPQTVAARFCVFPLFIIDGVLTLAADDPLNLDAIDQVRQVSKCEVDTVICDREKLTKLIDRAYSLSHTGDSGLAIDSAKLADSDSDDKSQPIIVIVNQLLADAAAARASDIHINPDEDVLHIRYRIDGVLREQPAPALSLHAGIVQRLKVMANLDLTQTRRPQDGKFRFTHENVPVEVRMSVVPTVCGENAVLRLLASSQTILDFTGLGFPAHLACGVEELIAKPYGMLLVTGPTGSGKTTTLYSILQRINDPSLNIMTIEDPVEIRLPFVRQIQVHHQIGLTFATALGSMLRQDPDIVLVGEIRDTETAAIALQAALTGHMVLSSLHTNDAAGAVARLRDFGLPPFVINSAVLGVIAQRLVRKVCQDCIAPAKIDGQMRHTFGLDENAKGFVKGEGCRRCAQVGYKGRLGIFELLRFTSQIQSVVESGGSTKQIQEQAQEEGMRLMWRDGLEKAVLGQTTLEEVLKAAAIIATSNQQQQVKMSA